MQKTTHYFKCSNDFQWIEILLVCQNDYKEIDRFALNLVEEKKKLYLNSLQHCKVQPIGLGEICTVCAHPAHQLQAIEKKKRLSGQALSWLVEDG